MSSVKSFVKKNIPFIYDFHLKKLEKREQDERMKWNKEYDIAVAELLNPEILSNKLAELAQNAKNGKNKTYYIVATENSKLGIYGYINCFLPHMAYAVYKGWIPVIDMKNYPSIYQKNSENAWELFYKQPYDVDYDVVMKNEHAILCPTKFWYHNLPSSYPLMEEEYLLMWSTLYNELIKYNNRSNKYIEEECDSILAFPDKTIGLIYRGTTYTKGQAIGHPIQPTMKMLKDEVSELLSQYEYVYVASDEKSIIEFLNDAFPGKVLINKRVYYDEADVDYSKYNIDGTDITADSFEREDNNYLIGLEYISSINIIAHCDCLIAGACGGTTAALYINGLQYNKRKVFSLGRYGIDEVPRE